jgi:glycosyltransferase involved in cell wall biosynthesis
MLHALRQGFDVTLVLGYNTAAFWLPYRALRRGKIVFNMDGLEWKRAKWGKAAKTWLLVNEKAALALSHHFVADHPVIMHRFRRQSRKGTMIPYGSFECEAADVSLLAPFGLEPFNYALALCRLEPENSVLEFVTAFCARRRDWKLAIVGSFTPDTNDYHARLQAAAAKRDGAVTFLGPVYDKPAVQALRYFARLYLHGHQVGGTNPSLVQALAAGNPALLHDNPFNRGVAGPKARFFSSASECAALLDILLDDEARLNEMGNASRERFHERFRWDWVLKTYEELLQTVTNGGR